MAIIARPQIECQVLVLVELRPDGRVVVPCLAALTVQMQRGVGLLAEEPQDADECD